MRMMVAEGLVKRYYHYADMKRTEIFELSDELTEVDNSENEDDVFTEDEI